ncbi:VVA0879 family protein [Streptomyces fagopyri]|uniref:VVA0879 family protein n=1 Tax=Streptomyces fagopyri TaxID=2662397 RepID=UPI003693F97C
MSYQRILTLDEFWAEARARFGEDPLNWAFQCPSCKDAATGKDFERALAERPRKHTTGQPVKPTDVLGQECIGRSLGALKGSAVRGCNYAAYGFIPAPWQVKRPDSDRPMYCFPLASASVAVGSGDGGAAS